MLFNKTIFELGRNNLKVFKLRISPVWFHSSLESEVYILVNPGKSDGESENIFDKSRAKKEKEKSTSRV